MYESPGMVIVLLLVICIMVYASALIYGYIEEIENDYTEYVVVCSFILIVLCACICMVVDIFNLWGVI